MLPRHASSKYLSSNDRGEDGFIIALERADGEEGPRKTLVLLLDFLDEAIGRPVADLLRDHGIKRLVVIPHRFLRLTPLWALASWVDLDVRMVPDASSLADPESGHSMTRTALVVTNPTLNLQMAATEGAITAGRLKEIHFDVRALPGAEASEDAVVERLQDVGLLHFAGHGHAALTDSSLSALLVSPDWSRAGVEGADALVTMANMAPDTPHLLIDQDEGSPHRKIYYAVREGRHTVRRRDGRRRRRCRRAVARGRHSRARKPGGVFARVSVRLFQRSWGDLRARRSDRVAGGARSGRCAIGRGVPAGRSRIRWRCSSQRSSTLARCRRMSSKVDVLSAVRGSAAALRTMERTDAVDRVEALAARGADAAARFRLRAYAKRLRSGSPRPFEHPFDWGAFFVTGAAEIALDGGQVKTH